MDFISMVPGLMYETPRLLDMAIGLLVKVTCSPAQSEYISGCLFIARGQIDEHDIGILSRPVKHNLFAVRSDVEGSHRSGVFEVRQGTGFHGSQIEQPKVLRNGRIWHKDQAA